MVDAFKRLLLLSLLASPVVRADAVLVAVASNFSSAAADIAAEFEASTDHDVRITTASTGKLYAQIVNGAPFDVFLAADAERPGRLERSGEAVSGSRFAYAVGRLVLWSRHPGLSDCRAALDDPGTGRVAIANPETAPYGAAAMEFLQRAGLLDTVEPRLVTAENISQALQFAATGNAALAFVAEAHLRAPQLPVSSCSWAVPDSLHAPIEQHAVLLARAADDPAAREWLAFLRSETARTIIEAHGYDLPGLVQ